jgi:hypothetical protein
LGGGAPAHPLQHLVEGFLAIVRLERALTLRSRDTFLLAPLGTSLIWLLFNASKPMTEQISALRQRMIDDMAFRNMSPNTQKVYASPLPTSPGSTGSRRTSSASSTFAATAASQSRGLRRRRSIRSSHAHCASAQVYLRQNVGRQ